MDSLTELLSTRATTSTVDSGYTFLNSECEPYAYLSYRNLHHKAIQGAKLLGREYPIGERVALLCPQGPAFIEAFFSCMYAGLIPVPIATTGNSLSIEERLAAISKVAQLKVAIVSGPSQEEPSVSHLAHLLPRYVSLIDLDDKTIVDEEEMWSPPPIPPGAIAFLQFTSGSTRQPKGVMVTHANVLANQQMIQQAFQTEESDRVLSWLPPYHDMGLIGGILHPLYVGADCFLMSPQHFARNPKRWLQAISRYAITVSGAPNSAFRMCSTLLQDHNLSDGPLDLRLWRIAFCGAEPVRQKDLDRFCSRFEEDGFRRSSFRVCYGLAEATLIVSCGSLAITSRGRIHPGPLPLTDTQSETVEEPVVSCGKILGTQDLRVVRPLTDAELPDGENGEILIAGENVALGYWGNPDDTSQTFSTILPSRTHRYLRTGDLGYIIRGELFVTGRIKDLLIIGGVNVHPQDIEFRAMDLLPSRRGGGTVVAFQEYDDGITLAVEVSRHDQQNLTTIANTLVRELYLERGVPIRRLILTRRGSIPRTTSGKVQRGAAKIKFATPTSEIVFEIHRSQNDPEADVEPCAPSDREGVAKVIRKTLSSSSLLARQGLDDENPGLPLVTLGIDSLKATEISARLESQLGILINPAVILDCPSFDEFVSLVQHQLVEKRIYPPRSSAVQAFESIDFTPDQLRLWFVEQTSRYPGSLIFQVAVEVVQITISEIITTVTAAQRSLSILCSNITVDGGIPRFRRHRDGILTLDVIDMSEFESQSIVDSAVQYCIRAHLRPFNATMEYLWRLQLILLPKATTLLVLSMNHLIADAHSALLLLDRLLSPAGADHFKEAAYSSFSEYVHHKKARAPDPDALQFWLSVLEIPSIRHSPGPSMPTDSFAYTESRPTIEAPLLHISSESAREHRTTLFCILLTAWQILQSFVLDAPMIVTAVPLLGRPIPEHRHTIGPFAHPVPIWTQLDDTTTSSELVATIHRRLVSFQRFSSCSLADAIEHDSSIGSLAHRLQYSSIFTVLDCREFLTKHKDLIPDTTSPRMLMPGFPTAGLFLQTDSALEGIIHSGQTIPSCQECSWTGDDYPRVLHWLASNPDRPIGQLRRTSELIWTSHGR